MQSIKFPIQILTIAVAAVFVLPPAVAHAQTLPNGVRVVMFQDPPPSTPDGMSWSTAWPTLQDALFEASQPNSPVTEIWVSSANSHLYTPDQGGSETPGDREASFELQSNLATYGGFAGGETELIQRDIFANPTILSGDLNGDDVPGGLAVGCPSCDVCGDGAGSCTVANGTPGCDDVMCCVIVCSNFDFCCTTEWDSLCVQLAGAECDIDPRGDNSFHVVLGEGDISSTAILDGFIITAGFANDPANQCDIGGGLLNRTNGAEKATIVNCTLFNNFALQSGGGVADFGGANSVSRYINCRFIGNQTSGDGGGLSVESSNPFLVNCEFSGNEADGDGGGLSNDPSGFVSERASLFNCTFTNNTAGGEGGGLDFNNGDGIVSNCNFFGNSAGTGSTQDMQIADPGIEPDIKFSCIEGLTSTFGEGNISSDPLFINADGPDDKAGTLDDNFRLSLGSPCADAGRNYDVPPDLGDIDLDSLFV